MKLLVLLVVCSSTAFAQSFDDFDFTWANGTNHQKFFPLVFKDEQKETVLTGMALVETYYNYDFNKPIDNTHISSGTIGRSNEFTVNLATVGFQSNYKNIIGKFSLQIGNILNFVQDQDPTVDRGRNTNILNVKYLREASAGYHFDVLKGLNVEMGVLSSFIALESYLTQENWSIQRGYVSDCTPFYFTGAKVQVLPSEHISTSFYFVNGFQSYNSWNKSLGIGNSTAIRPNENLQILSSLYMGNDSKTTVQRFHHDHSVLARLYNDETSEGLSQFAFSINNHFGFDYGEDKSYKTNFFAGTALSTRFWFAKNSIGLTFRGEYVTNPGLHLAYSPSPVTPNDYTDAIDADPLKRISIGRATVTLDYMPNDFVTFRLEYGYRHANHPYFAGRGGTTSPDGWASTPIPPTWRPDLVTSDQRITGAINFRL